MIASGPLKKMETQLASPVVYQLPVGSDMILLQEVLGKTIHMSYAGDITCKHCSRKTNKSFNQGYCYPCFRDLAQCDRCIMSPELCHYDQGTCREPEWGEKNCMTSHYVYLANSSGVKVGITRASQIPTRWIDQGAIQALPIAKVSSRHLSGRLEVIFKKHVADKTNWRTMLKGQVEVIDLAERRDQLINDCRGEIDALDTGLNDVEWLQEKTTEINYPVVAYPEKVTSMGFDKKPVIEGALMGIKGQYLILDTGVVNIRKHTSYHVDVTIS